MVYELDMETWKRREHFHFFKSFERPFFSVCAELDVTELQEHTRKQGLSFYEAVMYLATRAANDVEELRYRISGDRVIVHDVIHARSTVLRKDETIGFCTFDYDPDFARFKAAMKQKLEACHAGPPDLMKEHTRGDNVIIYSTLPWISFTGCVSAWTPGDSIPHITCGKRRNSGAVSLMPVCVELHHALADGLHVGRYLERFEECLRRCEQLLTPSGTWRASPSHAVRSAAAKTGSTDEIAGQIKEFILEKFLIQEDRELLTETTPLVTGGILDSLGTLKLVSFLEETFCITIEPHESGVDCLNTIGDIQNLVQGKLAVPGE